MNSRAGRRTAVAALVSAVLAASLISVSFAYFPGRQTAVVTVRHLSNGNSSLPIVGVGSSPCGKAVKSEPFGFVLHVTSNSPALLCVAFFYYNASASMHLVPVNQLMIFGWPINPSGSFSTFDAKPRFAITSQPSTLDLGGSSNQNERTEVTYYIQSNPGVNGIFEMNIGNILPGGIGCSGEFFITAGNGIPNYARPGLCHFVPANSGTNYPLTPGFLFVTMVGATNSTA